MEITSRTQNGVTLVVFAGSLDSNTSPQAQQAVDGMLAAGARKMAVDCTALDYISSAGLRVLMLAAKQVKAQGGFLAIAGVQPLVQEILEISKFTLVLRILPSVRDAVAAASVAALAALEQA